MKNCEEGIKIERVWSMPSKWTFSIPAISHLLDEEIIGVSVDPFSGSSTRATHRNDMVADQPNSMDALEWLGNLPDELADTVLYDPPYSITQARKYGKTEYASKKYWSDVKRELSRVLKPTGTAISFGWNSGGLGKINQCEIYRVLMVAHGGSRNDTIVTCERKRMETK